MSVNVNIDADYILVETTTEQVPVTVKSVIENVIVSYTEVESVVVSTFRGISLLGNGVKVGDVRRLNFIDGTNTTVQVDEYGNIVINSTGGGGSGTVESVTGNVVNNTDPANPVVTADPLGSAAQAETDANAYTDSLFVKGLPLVTASGTDTYTGTLTGFTVGAGKTIAVKIPNANTGAATFNLNSSSAKAIKKTGGTEDVAAGDLKAGGVYIFHDDGTNWQVIGVGGGGGGGGPAIADVYPNIAALLADQTNQEENAYYWVEDATTDPSVTLGWAIYRKLAASTADLSDYVKVQEQESLDIEVNDATDSTKGIVQLAGDLSGTAAAPKVLTNKTFNAALHFDKNYVMQHTIAGAVGFTKKGTHTPVVGRINRVYLKANGTNIPTFSSDFTVIWDNWDNTANMWNICYFEYLPSGKIAYWLQYTEVEP
jgi:hypothetical protein